MSEVPPSVFVGGVDISRACLEVLCAEGFPPALVIGYDESRRDASGYSDLAEVASGYGLESMRVRDVNDESVVERIESIAPAILYVIGWSQLVGPRLLEVPRLGSVGIHPTRLPDGRGRAPIPWTILKGLRSTACSMFILTEGVDDGPIIDQVEIEVDERETAATLYAKHRDAHRELLHRNARRLLEGSIDAAPQDEGMATYWERRRPEDGLIDWGASAEEVDRLVRAVTHPFPGAFTEGPDGRVRIWAAEPRAEPDLVPGEVASRGDRLYVGCGTGSLRVLEHDGVLHPGSRLRDEVGAR